MDDLGWSSYTRREEDANYRRCIEAAKRDGHTQRQAERCEAGALKCMTCPWKEELQKLGKRLKRAGYVK